MKRRRIMKKAFAMLVTAAAALVIGAFSAAAADVNLDTKTAYKDDNAVSFNINSNKLSASRFTDSTSIEVGCTGFEGDTCPAKLKLSYWKASEANDNYGEPASVEVEMKEYKDGKAVFAYEDIKNALGETDPTLVYSMDVVVADKNASIGSFDAKNVLSNNEAADQGILHTVWVHAKSPQESSNWGQSMTIEVDQFDVSYMTPESKALVLFTSDAAEDVSASPVEFILQSIDDNVSPKAKNSTVWAKVRPITYGNTFAVFAYDDMVNSYGTDDFTCVSTVHVGDTGKNTIAASDLFVFNCKNLHVDEPKPVEESSAAPDESQAAVTTAAPTESAPATVTEAAAATEADKSSTGNSIIFIIIGVVAGVGIAVAALFIILGRKSKETYDISKHRYVKKK